MVESTLDRVLGDLDRLKPDELSRVRRAVEARMPLHQHDDDREEAFLTAMLECGLISEIKRPERKSKLDRPGVDIHGKPLSETIVEDRR